MPSDPKLPLLREARFKVALYQSPFVKEWYQFSIICRFLGIVAYKKQKSLYKKNDISFQPVVVLKKLSCHL